jgi:hypothetical protein
MQAFFFVALVGFFMTAVMGVLSQTSLSSMQLVDLQRADTERLMQSVEFLINKQTVMSDIRVPTQSSMGDYLETDSILRGANWVWGSTRQDPWGNDFFVHVVYQDYPLRASVDGIVVAPQAAGFIIASPGPDKVFDASLNSDLSGLNGSSTINAVMRIEARPNTDDIVHTFNTRRALEKRWEMVETSVKQLARIAVYQYQQKYADPSFQAAVQDYYVSRLSTGSLFDSSGAMNISGVLDEYKSPAGGTSSAVRNALVANSPNMADYDQVAQAIAGTNMSNNSSGSHILRENSRGTGFRVQAQAFSSAGPGGLLNDRLRINLDPPTGTCGWCSSNGQLHFYLDVGDGV